MATGLFMQSWNIIYFAHNFICSIVRIIFHYSSYCCYLWHWVWLNLKMLSIIKTWIYNVSRWWTRHHRFVGQPVETKYRVSQMQWSLLFQRVLVVQLCLNRPTNLNLVEYVRWSKISYNWNNRLYTNHDEKAFYDQKKNYWKL